MKIVIMGTYPDKEDTVLSTTTYDVRPNQHITASTEKGTQFVNSPGDPDGEVVIRVPLVSETPAEEPAEEETVPA